MSKPQPSFTLDLHDAYYLLEIEETCCKVEITDTFVQDTVNGVQVYHGIDIETILDSLIDDGWEDRTEALGWLEERAADRMIQIHEQAREASQLKYEQRGGPCPEGVKDRR